MLSRIPKQIKRLQDIIDISILDETYIDVRVPINYYLCDNGYTNVDGFLSPYRSVRYHLDDWGEGNSRLRNKEKFFNMMHSKARNVIKRAFGLLKRCWTIMKSDSHYSIKV
ncbi:hypothetical protein Pfo_031042 [Paulownia fortunei]|nr:hypothetical protein Pfo_031042 [Paulownia fortunei]